MAFKIKQLKKTTTNDDDDDVKRKTSIQIIPEKFEIQPNFIQFKNYDKGIILTNDIKIINKDNVKRKKYITQYCYNIIIKFFCLDYTYN